MAKGNTVYLEEIVIPSTHNGKTVSMIAENAFANVKVKNITIPDSVTSIGSSAFYNCSNLTIYCEAESKPSGWGSNWNSSKRPVVWGHKGE